MSDDDTTDAARVALALAGDRAALGALLARHYPSALRLCRRLLGDGHEAHDVAQEAALQALLGLERLSDHGRFGAWLHAIAANLARMAIRRRRPLSLDALGEAGPLVLWPRPAPLPEAVHEARETHDAIVAALAELPPHERDVALGFFLEGYSYAELAECSASRSAPSRAGCSRAAAGSSARSRRWRTPRRGRTAGHERSSPRWTRSWSR